MRTFKAHTRPICAQKYSTVFEIVKDAADLVVFFHIFVSDLQQLMKKSLLCFRLVFLSFLISVVAAISIAVKCVLQVAQELA